MTNIKLQGNKYLIIFPNKYMIHQLTAQTRQLTAQPRQLTAQPRQLTAQPPEF